MKTVILCGGYGTRIRDVADDIPKPMIPVGHFPILWHIMKYYAAWQHREFILCLGYKGNLIKDFFFNYDIRAQDFTLTLGGERAVLCHTTHEEIDWKVTLADTGNNSMTGARVRQIRKYILPDENFLLTYGDGVGDVDLDKLVRFHKAHGKIMTVTGVRPPARFGELVSDKSGRVLEFNEKPQTSGGRISGGFFVCRSALFDYLDDREDLVLENEPMRQLVKDGQMMVYEHDGFWHPMDTARDYALLNSLFNSGKAPWVIWK